MSKIKTEANDTIRLSREYSVCTNPQLTDAIIIGDIESGEVVSTTAGYLKTLYAGSIAENNTGFVIGADVATALADKSDTDDVDAKVDKVEGMGLSHEDYTAPEKDDVATLSMFYKPINDALNAINGESVRGGVPGKLSRLDETKEAIRQAIHEKGVEITTDEPFSVYPDKIGQLPDIHHAEWEPDPDWWDIVQKVKECPDPCVGVLIIPSSAQSSDDSFLYNTFSGAYHYEMSDGKVYDKSDTKYFIHNWDPAYDEVSERGVEKGRWCVMSFPGAEGTYPLISVPAWSGGSGVIGHNNALRECTMLVAKGVTLTGTFGDVNRQRSADALQSIKMIDAKWKFSQNPTHLFANCTSLQEIPDLESEEEFIGVLNNTFENCWSLRKSPRINLPGAAIGTNFFSGCSSLRELNTLIYDKNHQQNTGKNFLVNTPALRSIDGLLATVMIDGESRKVYDFSFLQGNLPQWTLPNLQLQTDAILYAPNATSCSSGWFRQILATKIAGMYLPQMTGEVRLLITGAPLLEEIGDIVLGPDAYLGNGVFVSNYNLTRIPKIVWPASNYPTSARNGMFQGDNRLRSVDVEIPEGCAFFPSNYVSTNDYNYSVRTYIKLNPGRPTVSFSMGTTVSRNDANINVVSTAKNMADILMNLPQVSEQTVTIYGRSVETLYPEAVTFAESQGWTVVFD